MGGEREGAKIYMLEPLNEKMASFLPFKSIYRRCSMDNGYIGCKFSKSFVAELKAYNINFFLSFFFTKVRSGFPWQQEAFSHTLTVEKLCKYYVANWSRKYNLPFCIYELVKINEHEEEKKIRTHWGQIQVFVAFKTIYNRIPIHHLKVNWTSEN